MTLACFIICGHILSISSQFPVSGPAVWILHELPALLLLMAYSYAVVEWPIELSNIYSPVIVLVRDLLFIEEAVTLSMNLLYIMVTFALKLAFILSTFVRNKGMFLRLLIFLIWLFTQVHQAVQGTISSSRSYTVILIPLLLCNWFITALYIFWSCYYDFWAQFALDDWIPLDIPRLILNICGCSKEISRIFILF